MPPAYSVVATDLDGTLVHSDGTVSQRSRRALDRVQELGATVVITTGRPPRWLATIVEQTGLSGLAICANGAMLYDLDAGRVIAQHSLAQEAALRLVKALREELPGVQFAAETTGRFGREPGYLPLPGSTDAQVAVAEELLTSPVAKLLVRHPDRSVAEIYDAVVRVAGNDAEVHYSGDRLLELAGAGVSKASTLAALCDDLGVSADRVVGFGDMPNDLAMLGWVGHAVAVANAHPQVLAVADEVTASNDDDGVAQVLERDFAG